jgi:hypothetical protein
MEDWFPTPEQIDRAMKGGGRVSTSHQTFARELIDLFVERGWSRVFLRKAFRSLEDRHVGSHRAALFLEEWAKYKASRCLQATPAGVLLEIGIRPSIVAHLERRILAPFIGTCYTDPQLVDVAIEYLLRRRVPITQRDPLAFATHPFRPELTRSWFSPPEGFLTERTTTPATILFQNIPFRCSQAVESIVSAAIAALPGTNTGSIHFHSTSWEGAINILKNGINHAFGRKCLDFGLEPGFYLSQKIREALGWGYSLGQGPFENEITILIFTLPNRVPAGIRIQHLKDDEWVYVTRESRRCIRPSEIRRAAYYEIPMIENNDFLYGNMVANTYNVHKRYEDPMPHEPPKTQLASKTTRGDMFLQEQIVGCLFFQKYIPPSTNNTSNRSTRRTMRR